MAVKRIDAAAFIDWQAQLINSGAIANPLPLRAAQSALKFVSEQIASMLSELDSRSHFVVEMKLYHGWHRGLTPTESYAAVRDIMAERMAPQRVGRITYDWRQPFGCVLTDASAHRLHRILRVHLPNTLRAGIEDTVLREKMIDTALTCDVLSSARWNPEDVRLILAEDDDVVPSAFVAEKWAKERGGRTFIMRKRAAPEFLNLQGIFRQMEIYDA
ncbi:MAG TPA: hypothetical protein VEA60_12335 [Allosphingosinicella sp.]|nr:hypothetical protein [Allosphingosinicella sp.]